MFRVRYEDSASNELAEGWLNADSTLRQAITAASHAIEQRLRANADTEGESRSGRERLLFVPPLAATFRIEDVGRTVSVLHLRVYRRRKDT